MITSEWPTTRLPNSVPFIVRQVRFLREAGIGVEVFHFRGNQNPFNYLRAWFGVRRLLRKNNYDLVHAQFGQSGTLALPRRLPLVVTFRGDDLEGIVGKDGKYTLAGRVLRVVSSWVAKKADAVILVSASLKRHLSRLDVQIIPSGIDFGSFPLLPKNECRKRLGLSLTKTLVLFVGNPDERIKRYELAKQAVELLDPALQVELIVASGVQHAEIPTYMNACDALVFTSMHEGSPNVVKEALACNLRVVSVNVGDVAQRLAGVRGCAVCADDRPETLAGELKRVLQHGEPARTREAVSDLDEGILTQNLIAIYRRVLNHYQTFSICVE